MTVQQDFDVLEAVWNRSDTLERWLEDALALVRASGAIRSDGIDLAVLQVSSLPSPDRRKIWALLRLAHEKIRVPRHDRLSLGLRGCRLSKLSSLLSRTFETVSTNSRTRVSDSATRLDLTGTPPNPFTLWRSLAASEPSVSFCDTLE